MLSSSPAEDIYSHISIQTEVYFRFVPNVIYPTVLSWSHNWRFCNTSFYLFIVFGSFLKMCLLLSLLHVCPVGIRGNAESVQGLYVQVQIHRGINRPYQSSLLNPDENLLWFVSFFRFVELLHLLKAAQENRDLKWWFCLFEGKWGSVDRCLTSNILPAIDGD